MRTDVEIKSESGELVGMRPSAARPRLIVPRSRRTATGAPTRQSSRLTNGGTVCEWTVGGGAPPPGTAHGQNATVASGTSRHSAIDGVTS